MNKVIHEGRNIKRIREILGIKQEALAADLNISQQRLSETEKREKVDDELMKQIADILKVPVEAIKNFDEDAAVNIVSNTFHDTNGLINYTPTFNVNPVDKWMEVLNENKNLYERLLKSEQEKVALLEKVLEKK